MNIIVLILAICDFAIGLLFGNIGHFYSLLCFPLLALIRGYTSVNRTDKTRKSTIFTIISGAGIFFLGLIIGLFINVFRFTNNPENSLITSMGVGQALVFSIIISLIYFGLYIFFGLLSAYLCSEVNNANHIPKHTHIKPKDEPKLKEL